jgi:beta-galactosidase
MARKDDCYVDVDLNTGPILRLNDVGDVARVTLNGKLLTDDFYNGNTFEVGLCRYAPEILTGDLGVEILPLRRDAPIMLAQEARPDFGDRQSVVLLYDVKLSHTIKSN